MGRLKSFWYATAGATSIEYAVVGGIVTIAIVVSITTIGASLNAKFVSVLPALR